jgi:hypothetical protein
LVSHLLTVRRERERWDREDRRQREAREHEWQLRHRDDRLELYRRFLAELREIKPNPGTPDYETWGKAENTWREIELLGSEQVREAARALFLAEVNLADFQGRMMQHGESVVELPYRLQENDPPMKQELDRRQEESFNAYPRFLQAARKDLGMELVLPKHPESHDPEATRNPAG